MTENLTPCGRCSHRINEHSPECYHVTHQNYEGGLNMTISTRCPCPEFVEPKGERE